MNYEKVKAFNDWFDKNIFYRGLDNYSSNSGVSNYNQNHASTGLASNGFNLNADGSVDIDSLGTYGLDGLVDSVAAYFKASDPRIQYAWSAQEAQKERDWQTAMSNTAYQRSVADMQAAGINPIMAYSQGGASSGSGASASTSPANTGSSLGPILSGISSLFKTIMSEDRMSDAQADKAALAQLKYKDNHSAVEAHNDYLKIKGENIKSMEPYKKVTESYKQDDYKSRSKWYDRH